MYVKISFFGKNKQKNNLKTPLKHPEKIHETPLKHPWITLETPS